MNKATRTQRFPNFILIGRISSDDELDCVTAMNGATIESDFVWNALVRETHQALCIATGEQLLVWSVPDISAVLLPDANAITFAARIDPTEREG